MIERNLYIKLWEELAEEKQMIFLSGPRQVGKTTLAKAIAQKFTNSAYFNWDIISDKRLLMENPAFFENVNRKDESMPLVIFDELHKYKHWKNYLKGIYDRYADEYAFLVSGSGRLDLYQKGGDSLIGRYFTMHLFPFTIAELSTQRRAFDNFIKHPINDFDLNDPKLTSTAWQALFNMGGFPEPFTKSRATFYRKWANTYATQLVREDIRDITGVKDIDSIELLFSLLPSRVGSPLSLNNIAQDMQVAHGSIKNWLKLFETFFLIFRIPPWTRKISRAISKEKKLYLYNYPEIQDEAIRFENMVALELMRVISNWNEHGYGKFTLHYIRNKQKEEVDFLIANNASPVLLIEAKFSDDKVQRSLINFQNVLHIPAVQLVNKENVFKHIKNASHHILIITAHRWLSTLP